MTTASYRRPSSLDDALETLSQLADDDPILMAGATDVYPTTVGRPIDRPVLDLTGLVDQPDLRSLRRDESDPTLWRVPALATWSTIADADLPPLFDGLRSAARTIGGVQIQNVATLCGNLCNASPAADGIPNLLALDAVVELASTRGVRRLPVADFVLGNRRTARAPDELVTAVLVPDAPVGTDGTGVRSAFLKLGSRAHLVISMVMVAGTLEVKDDVVTRARVAVGACSPVALRLPDLEAALVGARLDELASTVTPDHLAHLSPIDDVRGTADYRRDAALTLVRRLLSDLGHRAGRS